MSFNDVDEFKQLGFDMCRAATRKTPCCVFERKEKAGFRAPAILDYVFSCKAVGDGDECKSTTFDENTMSKLCSAPIEQDLHFGYCSAPPPDEGLRIEKATDGSSHDAMADVLLTVSNGPWAVTHQGTPNNFLGFGKTPEAAFGIPQVTGPDEPGREVFSVAGKAVKEFTGVDAAINIYNCADHTRGEYCISLYGVEYCYKNESGYGILVGALVTASVAVFLQLLGTDSDNEGKPGRFLFGTVVLLFCYGFVYWSGFNLHAPDRQILALSFTLVVIVFSIFWDRIREFLGMNDGSNGGYQPFGQPFGKTGGNF